MGTIFNIISDLQFGRSALLKSFEQLSDRERTEIPVYDDWTVKDILAHIIGWDEFVIEILPLIVQDRANEIPRIDVEAFNRQSRTAWQEESFAQILTTVQSTHRQILDFISALDHVEIDKRRERNGRTITIRSYVVDIMLEHERQHALEIEQWRKNFDRAIDPAALRAQVLRARAKFMTILDRFQADDVLDKSAVGVWSISDMVGHIVDWEQIMLNGARHIYDPLQPAVTPLSGSIETWNTIMAAERAAKSWPENYHALRQSQLAVDNFIATLKSDHWKLRGPYPWSDYGTLAELLTHAAEHYQHHLPDVQQWYRKRYPNEQPNP